LPPHEAYSEAHGRAPAASTATSETAGCSFAGLAAGSVGLWLGLRARSRAAVGASTALPRAVLRRAAEGDGEASDANAAAKEEVLKQLRFVRDEGLGADIVTCGFVTCVEADREKGQITFKLEVGAYEETARSELKKLPWAREINIQVERPVESRPPASGAASASAPRPMPRIPTSLDKVKSIVAVSSCKGGVGKSTVAVNLAFELQKGGAKVGILDCDVYGPSLPVMVRMETTPQMEMYQDEQGQKHIRPIVHPETGIKMVSFGYAGKAAVMRGSMVTGLISQLVTQTDWDELDYLVLDLPPGTGDIHLTLAQVCQITAAVIVTTPQKLSIIDVERGISMFSQLAVPSVAVVQNMSYISLPNGDKQYPFGKTNAGRGIADTFGIDHVFELPLEPTVSDAGDSGLPFVTTSTDGDAAAEMTKLAAAVKQEVSEILAGVRRPQVTYDSDARYIKVELPDGEAFAIDPTVLRLRDKGAGGASPPPEGSEPAEIREMGNYAVVIRWSDNFVQVAPHRQLIEGDEKGPMPRVPLGVAVPEF